MGGCLCVQLSWHVWERSHTQAAAGPLQPVATCHCLLALACLAVTLVVGSCLLLYSYPGTLQACLFDWQQYRLVTVHYCLQQQIHEMMQLHLST